MLEKRSPKFDPMAIAARCLDSSDALRPTDVDELVDGGFVTPEEGAVEVA